VRFVRSGNTLALIAGNGAFDSENMLTYSRNVKSYVPLGNHSGKATIESQVQM
jgi:hypothetical protein